MSYQEPKALLAWVLLYSIASRLPKVTAIMSNPCQFPLSGLVPICHFMHLKSFQVCCPELRIWEDATKYGRVLHCVKDMAEENLERILSPACGKALQALLFVRCLIVAQSTFPSEFPRFQELGSRIISTGAHYLGREKEEEDALSRTSCL